MLNVGVFTAGILPCGYRGHGAETALVWPRRSSYPGSLAKLAANQGRGGLIRRLGNSPGK